MRKIIYICDRCGKELDINEPWMAVVYDEDRMDFCEDCAGKVLDVINNFLTDQPKEEQQPEPQKRKRGGPNNKSRLDIAKIGALYAAGWSTSKIAAEFNVSTQTIRNHKEEAEAVYKKALEELDRHVDE